MKPNDYRWYYYQALLEEDSGHLEGMAELLKKTRQFQPAYHPGNQKLADLSFKQGRWGSSCGTLRTDLLYEFIVRAGRFGSGMFGSQKTRMVPGDPISRTGHTKYPLLRLPHQMMREAYQASGQRQRASEKERFLSRSDLTHEIPASYLLREDCFLLFRSGFGLAIYPHLGECWVHGSTPRAHHGFARALSCLDVCHMRISST